MEDKQKINLLTEQVKKAEADKKTLAGMVKQARADNQVLSETLTKTTKLATDAATALDEAQKAQIAAKAGAAVEDGAAAAMTATAADTISTETADAVVEAVTKLDPAIGSELSDAVIQAEAEKDGLTGEKMAALITPALTKLAGKNLGGALGTVKIKDKKASASTGINSGNDLQTTKLAQLGARLTSRS